MSLNIVPSVNKDNSVLEGAHKLSPLESLPTEILLRVLDCLDWRQIEKVGAASKRLQAVILYRNDFEAWKALQGDIEKIIPKLDQTMEREVISVLQLLQGMYPLQGFNSLTESRCFWESIKNQLVDVFKTLPLNRLQELGSEFFWRNSIQIARVCQNILRVEEEERWRVVDELMGLGGYRQALDAAFSISDKGWRLAAIRNIVEDLISRKHFAEVDDLLENLQDYCALGELIVEARGGVLCQLVKDSVKKGRFDQAKKIACTIEDSGWRENGFEVIVGGLVSLGRLEEAKEYAQKAPDQRTQEKAFLAIVRTLCNPKHRFSIDEVKTIALAIKDEQIQGEALESLVWELIKTSRHEEAESIAWMINHPQSKDRAFAEMLQALVNKPNLDPESLFDALSWVRSMPDFGVNFMGVVESWLYHELITVGYCSSDDLRDIKERIESNRLRNGF